VKRAGGEILPSVLSGIRLHDALRA